MDTASLTHTEPTAGKAEMSGTAFSGLPQSGRHQRPRRFNPVSKALVGGCWATLLLLSSCTSEPSKPAEKPEVKAPDFITGRSGFQKAYVAARGWQQDAKPYRLESSITSDGNGHDGKSAIWRGSFASAERRAAKSWTWSGSNAEGAPERGVNPGIEDSYSPTNASTQVFDPAFLKIDSDQAFATSQKHGGDKTLEKEPNTPVLYVLDWNHNTNELVWHVVYGSSRDNAKLTVAVNASSGAFIRVEK